MASRFGFVRPGIEVPSDLQAYVRRVPEGTFDSLLWVQLKTATYHDAVVADLKRGWVWIQYNQAEGDVMLLVNKDKWIHQISRAQEEGFVWVNSFRIEPYGLKREKITVSQFKDAARESIDSAFPVLREVGDLPVLQNWLELTPLIVKITHAAYLALKQERNVAISFGIAYNPQQNTGLKLMEITNSFFQGRLFPPHLMGSANMTSEPAAPAIRSWETTGQLGAFRRVNREDAKVLSQERAVASLTCLPVELYTTIGQSSIENWSAWLNAGRAYPFQSVAYSNGQSEGVVLSIDLIGNEWDLKLFSFIKA